MLSGEGAEPSEAKRLRALRASGLLHHRGGAFEAEVTLVRQALGVPVALVSLVEGDRQVFAGQQGLPEPWATRGETPLTHSFCQHVVAQRAPFAVSDSLREPLVDGNLAIADLNVRAYIGVPLSLPTGEVVGALAAIDVAPRAWGADDLATLQAIAEVVGKSIRASLEERKWRGLFAEMQEGLVLGEVVRDAAGRATDWRYVEVNRAWSGLAGIPSEAAVGRTVRELFPAVEDEWVAGFAEVVDTGEPIAFTRQVGALQRWYDGFAQPAGGERFVALFVDVTERVLANARRDALVELGDRLREADGIGTAALIGAEAMGRALHASRAGFGAVDAVAETVDMQPDWCAPGIASIAGPYSFRDFGTFIEDLKRGDTVIIPDVATDPRTAAFADAFTALAIRQLVNVPVMAHGALVAVMFVHHADLHPLSPDEVQFVKAVADRTQAAIAQLQAEADQAVLNEELSHRMKNTLALVQAIVTQTLRDVPDQGPVDRLVDRLHALAAAHDILMQSARAGSDLGTTARAVLATFDGASRVSLDGPPVALAARAVLSLSLVLHELGTNATKHGALSVPEGRVDVAWAVANRDGEPWLELAWRERGGPPAAPPTRRGFGSRLLATGLAGTGRAEVRYLPGGVEADFDAPLAQLQGFEADRTLP